jgi:TRAP-type C4-dicarboxylate transport system permease small subunit
VTAALAWLSRAVAGVAAAATALCLALVCYAVVMRYALGAPQPWVDKVAGWLVVALVLLAAPEAQRRFEHIGVDVALARVPPRVARGLHLVGTLSVALVAAVLVVAGWEAVAFSRMVGLMTDLPGVPEWWIQLLLPLGAALLFLVALGQSVQLARGEEPAHLPRPDADPIAEARARAE